MSTGKTFLLIHATPNPENMDLMQEYLSKMMPVFGKNQGEMVSRFKVTEQLVGDGHTKMVAVLSFPDPETVRTLVASNEYKEHAELRAKVFLKLELLLSESL